MHDQSKSEASIWCSRPGASVTAWHASFALLAASAIPGIDVKVCCCLDGADILRVIGTHHWQCLAHCIFLFQHVQDLQSTPGACLFCTCAENNSTMPGSLLVML